MKILIVDDSAMDKKLLSNMLKKIGIECDIIVASDGEEGFQLLSKHYQDVGLILLDWQMPKMDGIEFMKGIVNVPEVANIPIVMVTASSSEDNRVFAKKINPKLAGYIVKPYNKETLLKVVGPFFGLDS